RAADVLADHVQSARTGGEADAAATTQMIAELEVWTRDGPSAAGGLVAASEPAAPAASAGDGADFGFRPMTAALPDLDMPAETATETAGHAAWIIRFRPHPALYAKANETALLLR